MTKKCIKGLFYLVKNFFIDWFKWASTISLIFMLCLYLGLLQTSGRNFSVPTTTINTNPMRTVYNAFKMFLSLSLIYIPVALAGIQQAFPFMLKKLFEKASSKNNQ